MVPAGRFEGCFRRHSAVGMRSFKHVDDWWFHPAVPLSGAVRRETDEGFVMELVGYGTTGARSEF